MFRSSQAVMRNSASFSSKKVAFSSRNFLPKNNLEIISSPAYVNAFKPALNISNRSLYSTEAEKNNENKQTEKKKSNLLGYLLFGIFGILTGVLVSRPEAVEIVKQVPPLKMIESSKFTVPEGGKPKELDTKSQSKPAEKNGHPIDKLIVSSNSTASSIPTPTSIPTPASTSSSNENKSNNSDNSKIANYQSLLEKKQKLLEELEIEVNHLRSHLIKVELYNEKRERQFEEVTKELKHVKDYLINEEFRTSIKDKEIEALNASLSNAQKIMEKALDSLKEEHNIKIKELNEIHNAELKEVENSLDAVLEDQRKMLEQEFLKQNQERIEKLRELTEKVYAVEESFHRSSSYLVNSVRLQKLTAAVLALQQVLKTDAPFTPEMKVLSEEGYGDRLIEELVYAIPKEIQREGLPCRHDLYREFCKIDRKVLEASYIPTSAGFFGLLYSKIVGTLLIQENGLVDGETVDAKLARARVYLLNDKLSLALEELSDIKGEAREVLQPWLTQAQYRLVADQSIEILHAHITNLSASLIE